MGRKNVVRMTVVVLVALLWIGCKSLTQGGSPEEKFKETDYLNEFAGVYQTRIPGAAEMGRIVTLQLYPDGTCLLAEKDLGRPPDTIRIRRGRWDHSDFPHRIDLHLNTPQGAKSRLTFDRTEDGLVHDGNQFGLERPVLIRP